MEARAIRLADARCVRGGRVTGCALCCLKKEDSFWAPGLRASPFIVQGRKILFGPQDYGLRALSSKVGRFFLDPRITDCALYRPRQEDSFWAPGLRAAPVILGGRSVTEIQRRAASLRIFCFFKMLKRAWHFLKQKIPTAELSGFLSGWQDSNLRPPGPKPGAMTGLRYTPWRRVRDSNPWYSFPYACLANMSFRPLRQLSVAFKRMQM